MSAIRGQIIETAADLIWSQGFGRTSVDQIIDAAEVSKGSFYHHFSSKDDVGLAAIDTWAEAVTGCLEGAVSERRTALENLQGLVDAFVEFQRDTGQRGCPLGRMALETADLSEAFRRRIESSFGRVREIFARYLEMAGLREQAARDYARLLLATIEGALLVTRVNGGGEAYEKLMDQTKTQLVQHVAACSGAR